MTKRTFNIGDSQVFQTFNAGQFIILIFFFARCHGIMNLVLAQDRMIT